MDALLDLPAELATLLAEEVDERRTVLRAEPAGDASESGAVGAPRFLPALVTSAPLALALPLPLPLAALAALALALFTEAGWKISSS